MLEALQIGCVRGSRRLFAALNFRVEPKQALRIAGDNGAGKTSLLRIVAGLLPAEAGEVRWGGQDIHALGEDYRRNLAFLGHANGLKDELSAVENLRQSLAIADVAVGDAQIRDGLRDEGLAAIADLPVRLLSQGQKRRVALAKLAFCGAKRVWVLDEPFAALDAAAVTRLAARLAAYLADGGMLLFTTHQDVALPGAAVQSLRLGEA